MEKNVVITVGVNKASLQETNKTIGGIYATAQKASRETKVIVDANTAPSATLALAA